MASAWGKAWGLAWGKAWGSIDVDEPEPADQPGGSHGLQPPRRSRRVVRVDALQREPLLSAVTMMASAAGRDQLDVSARSAASDAAHGDSHMSVDDPQLSLIARLGPFLMRR